VPQAAKGWAMSEFDAGRFDPYNPQGGEPAKTSLLAVSGFVCSVIICCPVITPLLGLLLGVGGLVSISSSNGRRKGTGLAAGAIIISILALLGQVMLMQAAAPYFKQVFRAAMFAMTGPTIFLSDLERGDLSSARSHLDPTFDAKITDEQLRDFARQVADRYGSVEQWQPVSQHPLNPTPGGAETFEVTSQLRFANGARRATMSLMVSYDAAGRFPIQSGITGIVIHDPDLGDLTFDEKTPTQEAPPAPPKEPDGDGGG